MKISFSWLKRLVALPDGVNHLEVARRLTLGGLEVEAIEEVGKGLAGAVVAEVRGKRPHPHGDRLTLVEVFDGAALTQVVCGASNVPEPGAPGRSPLVVWARPGAILPSGMVLTEREVRGIRSPGMLCAEDELGLSEDHQGILVLSPDDGLAPGSDFAQAVGLPDPILDLNVTPNRPDCLGHVGVAREVAALFRDAGARLTLREVDLGPSLDAEAEVPEVRLLDEEACPRYTALVIRPVRVGRSPLSLRLLLRRLGVRALSSVVDATNLAMLEWGQPLHAFDLARLRGRRIEVRRARDGESIRTLDGVVRALCPEDLVIADAERPVAIAGVMGGEETEVTDGTTDLLLESACFSPQRVRRTAKRLKLCTEASLRFERGVDPNDGLVRAALSCGRAILDLCGGRTARGLIDAYPRRIERRVIALRPARTSAVLGCAISAPEQERLLCSLGLLVDAQAAPDALEVSVPTFRPDLAREIDLIEEIGRLHGYDHIEPGLPPLRLGQARPGSLPPSHLHDRARDLCRALGLSEIHTFAFTSPERIRQLGYSAEDPRGRPLLLENPLREELSALRPSLIPGLLEALRRNQSQGERSLRLFEVGEIFLDSTRADEGQVVEVTRVAGAMCGYRDTWLKPGPLDELDVFDARGVVEELLAGMGRRISDDGSTAGALHIRAAAPGEVPWLHPGVAAVVVDNESGRPVGAFGEIHPDLRARTDIVGRAFAFELDVPLTPPATPVFAPLWRFPGTSRDLSFFVDVEVPAAQLLAVLRGAPTPLLVDVEVLEDYREAGRVPPGKKGMLLSLTYRSPERTLTDDEVRQAHDAVIAHLRGRMKVDLR